MSEAELRKKLKCPEIEELRRQCRESILAVLAVGVTQAQPIIEGFDQRNEEIIRRMNEMQSWIDAGQAAAEIEHARQHVVLGDVHVLVNRREPITPQESK